MDPNKPSIEISTAQQRSARNGFNVIEIYDGAEWILTEDYNWIKYIPCKCKGSYVNNVCKKCNKQYCAKCINKLEYNLEACKFICGDHFFKVTNDEV
jgi:hypothetical protein